MREFSRYLHSAIGSPRGEWFTGERSHGFFEVPKPRSYGCPPKRT
jgi:hypothetical protein